MFPEQLSFWRFFGSTSTLSQISTSGGGSHGGSLGVTVGGRVDEILLLLFFIVVSNLVRLAEPGHRLLRPRDLLVQVLLVTRQEGDGLRRRRRRVAVSPAVAVVASEAGAGCPVVGHPRVEMCRQPGAFGLVHLATAAAIGRGRSSRGGQPQRLRQRWRPAAAVEVGG